MGCSCFMCALVSEQPLALQARGNGKGRGHKAQFVTAAQQ